MRLVETLNAACLFLKLGFEHEQPLGRRTATRQRVDAIFHLMDEFSRGAPGERCGTTRTQSRLTPGCVVARKNRAMTLSC
jgi:hypothetical protein